MREVRMTFGEHLEELRRRIIFALIYIAGGVIVALSYGTDLMDLALEPHYTAFRAAKRNRLIGNMEEKVNRLVAELTSVEPAAGADGKEPLVEGEVHWELFFLRDAALPQLYRRLQEPYVEWAGRARETLATLPADALGETVRKLLDDLVSDMPSLGENVARSLVAEFASELELDEISRIPRRLRRLEERLSEEEAKDSIGPTRIQRFLGWGKDLRGVLEPLGKFLHFLELRKEQALASEIPLDVLRERAREARMPRLLDVVSSLEEDADKVVEGLEPRIWVISYIESFSSYFKVAVIVGAFLALPGVLYEMWKFIGAGLYAHEQKYVVTILPFSIGLFVVGVLFGYFIMIPVGLEFLAGWGIESVEMSFTLGSYIGLFFTLTLILGLVFQTPLLMIFLAKIGVLNVDLYRRGRRVAVFIGVILAVVLTPPDPFSWSLMAGPMILLYEVGILCCRWLVKPQSASAES